MKKLLFLSGMLAILLSACAPKTATDPNANDHADVKLQLLSYNQDFELFAEADPFVVDQPSSILAHFTQLENFKPFGNGSITLSLIVGTKGIRQTIDEAVRSGIYSFELVPVASGKGQLIFDIKYDDGESKVIVEDIYVYEDIHTAIYEAEEQLISNPNGIVFTKEQSWKVDFSTLEVRKEEFGQVIKTGAMITPAQNDKVNIVARTSGIVVLQSDNIFEGTAVRAGMEMFSISGAGLAGNNTQVRFVEARNNFEAAESNYDRMKILAEDKIVSQSDLLEAKRQYETTRVVYENLKDNFREGAQVVKSPIDGFVNHLYVSNGEFVEAGQALLEVAQNQKLVLMADVQQKYSGILKNIVDANIRLVQENKTYTLEELNGKLSSYGRSVNHDNYLIPVRFEIENTGGFVAGSYVELFIITQREKKTISVPNTALLEEQGKHFVMVQLTPELYEKREVIIGATDGLRTEITDGLIEGERIIGIGAILVKLSQSSGALDPHAGHVH